MINLTENQRNAVDKLKEITSDVEIFWDEKTLIPKFAKGKLSKPSTDSPKEIALAFLDNNKDLLDLQQGLNEELTCSEEVKDKQGFNHVCCQQFLNGIPVFEGSIQVHINADGEVVTYKDNRISKVDIPLEPKINLEEAYEIAIADIDKNKVIKEKKGEQVLYRDSENKLYLAWKLDLQISDESGCRHYFIDARSGRIIYKFARIRGMLSRMTYTANNREVLPGNLVVQDDQNTPDEIAQAAHDNAKIVYDYYKNEFGRDSFDNAGTALVSTVHFAKNMNNAFWTDTYKQMVYGDGDGVRWEPLAFALDVVGHEFTHAVTSDTARFVYAEEAGALDESFADFFGVMISNDDSIIDWEMGEDVFTPFRAGDALRDLSDPPKYGQPDHMDDYIHLGLNELPDPDKNDNGYVHANSGIPNKAGYLVVNGGIHHGITVAGIGRDKAEQIYYLALTEYMRSSTQSKWTFKQARYALLNACRQLYGDSGSEYTAIKNAWAAVGIGDTDEELFLVKKEISPQLAIPDNDPSGIQNTINIIEQGILKEISLDLEIEHTYIGDLIISITSPSGEIVVLHNREGGFKNNIKKTYDINSTPALMSFIGDQIQGDWTLQVSDNARIDTGNLVSWGMSLLIQKVEKKSIKKEVSPGLNIPDNDPGGVESVINIDESGRLINVDVVVDICHTWIGDLRVILSDPSGNEVTLHNRSGYSRHNIKKTYSTKTHEFMQILSGNEILGNWKLKVIDLAKEDLGTLNEWSLEITYE